MGKYDTKSHAGHDETTPLAPSSIEMSSYTEPSHGHGHESSHGHGHGGATHADHDESHGHSHGGVACSGHGEEVPSYQNETQHGHQEHGDHHDDHHGHGHAHGGDACGGHGHGHGDDHEDHAEDPEAIRRMKIAVVICFAFMIVEVLSSALDLLPPPTHIYHLPRLLIDLMA